MKHLRRFFVILIIVVHTNEQYNAFSQHHDTTTVKQVVAADTVKKSIPKEEHVMIGGAHIRVNYYAPAVRGRIIWGGLVPFEEVWVTGAHNATSLEISKNFVIKNKEIPAGKYAVFTIPGKEKWTIILNKNWDQHLADEYDKNEDVIRIEVTPKYLPNIQERLNYRVVSKSSDAAMMSIRWEKIEVSLPFDIK